VAGKGGELMKAENFDEIVKARANERVQRKIEAFREDCKRSATELIGVKYCGYSDRFDDAYRTLFAILASNKHTEGWPSSLWKKERELVSDELLRVMDEMQRAFLAASKADPGENKEEVPA
jgi:hypothetical protein